MQTEIVVGGVPSELKHLSRTRKINQVRDSVSSGERKRKSLNPVIVPLYGIDRGLQGF